VKWLNLLVASTILGAGIWAATLIRDGSAMVRDLTHAGTSTSASALGQGMIGLGYLIFVVISGCGLVLLRPRWLALGTALPAATGIFASAFLEPSRAAAATLLAVPVALLAAAAGVIVHLVRLSILDDVPNPVVVVDEVPLDVRS
jgi:hypothetical protein